MQGRTLKEFLELYDSAILRLVDNAESCGQEGDAYLYESMMETVATLRSVRESVASDYPLHTQFNTMQIANLMKEKGVLDELRFIFEGLSGDVTSRISELERERSFLKQFCSI